MINDKHSDNIEIIDLREKSDKEINKIMFSNPWFVRQLIEIGEL